MAEKTLYRGEVTRIGADGAYVEVPHIGRAREIGPLQAPSDVAVGQKVAVGVIEDNDDDMVIVQTFSSIYQPKRMPKDLGSVIRAILAGREQRTTRLVFLGSSTTQGVGAAVPSQAYVAQLGRRIQACYPTHVYGDEPPVVLLADAAAAPSNRPGVQIINGGIGGTFSNGYAPAATRNAIDVLNPQIIFHMIGANDYWFGVPPADYHKNVENVLKQLDALVPGVIHVLLHTYARPDSPALYHWDKYGAEMQALASRRVNTHFININDMFKAVGVPATDIYDVIGPDNIHMTEIGHYWMAELIARALNLNTVPQRPEPTMLDRYLIDGLATAIKAETGQPYEVGSGTWAAAGKRMGLSAAGNLFIESGLTNGDVDVSAIITMGGGTTPGLLFRSLDNNNRMGVFLNYANTNFELYIMDGGVNTLITFADYTFVNGVDYRVRVISQGNKVACYLNGALLINYTMTSAAYTKFGPFTKIGYRSSAAHADVKWRSLSARPAA